MAKRVAIIGSSFRLPGTDNSRCWNDLLTGCNLVTEVDAGRFAKDAFFHPNKNHPGTSYTFGAGSVGDVSLFDAGFFGISPREAALMDPQQRLLLEMSWEMLERAGIKPSSLRGSQCSVYIGISSVDYSYRLIDDLAAVDTSSITGNTSSIAANRLSYFYDLRGPSMALDTACSSSLVAFHQACCSILSGESTQAFVGGISLHLHPYAFVAFSKQSMLSRNNRCGAFDAFGDGYVRSEGGAMFFLKDFDRAIAEGNRILAVVANTAVNTDGRKSGLTIPNPDAQAQLLLDVYDRAGIDPTDIDYIEAHGTGTAVGDPIETRALGKALGQRRPKGKPLLIGSIKSNLGHLEAASGVAGLVKALYCIQHRLVPATIGLKTPNPQIHFDEWNLEVATENRPLKKSGELVIGVNSFGFGGANAHVILQSHEARPVTAFVFPEGDSLPIILSAKSDGALKAAAGNFVDFLKRQPESAFYDIAYETALRRDWLGHRAIVFAKSSASVIATLQTLGEEAPATIPMEVGTPLELPRGPAFIYSGNGALWAGVGKNLLADLVFEKTVRQIDVIFRQYGDICIEDELKGDALAHRFDATEIAQPILFAIQVGVTQMLCQRGIVPLAVAGHSVGEAAAAWAAGALSLEAATKLVYFRSQLQGRTRGRGQMTAVSCGESSIRKLLNELGATGLTVAGINSSKGTTLAGPLAELSRLESILGDRGISYKRLELDYAFHSAAMDDIEKEFKQALGVFCTAEATLPFYSTVTGTPLEAKDLDAEYWWRNLRNPVVFERAIKNIQADGINIFVEIGPRPVLRGYINDCLKDLEMTGRVIPTLVQADDRPQRVLSATCQTMIAGASVNWQRLFPQPGRPVELPAYPWQRERHWHSVSAESQRLLYREKPHPLLGYHLPQHELTWENRLDTLAYPMLADHVVGGATLFPGAGFLELAIAAALVRYPEQTVEIENLEIRLPLLLSDEQSKVVRFNIDEKDGEFFIKARKYAHSEPWELHAVGQILHEPKARVLAQDPLTFSRVRDPDFDGHDHAQLMDKSALSYGPAFQAIDHGWVEKDAVYASLRVPTEIEAAFGEYHLHPAIVDSALQLVSHLLKNAGTLSENVVFVPTKIGLTVYRPNKARPAFVRATLLRHNSHSVLADFSLYDATGVPIAVMSEVRFRGVRLPRTAHDRLRYLNDHLIAAPRAVSPDIGGYFSFKHIVEVTKEQVEQCVLKGSHRRYSDEVDPLLDGLCSQFLRETFDAISKENIQPFSEESLIADRDSNIVPFLKHLLVTASEDGVIEATENGLSIVPAPGNMTSKDIWNSLVNDYPDFFQIIHAVGRAGLHLQSLLARSHAANPVHFSDEVSLSALRQHVLGIDGKQSVGHGLRDLVVKTLNDLPQASRLGILEIGGRTPIFASEICPGLDFDRSDYVFASTSAVSVEQALCVQEKFPAMTVRQIETITTGPDAAGRFHLAIVAVDFATAQEALCALEYSRSQLVPGGSLIVLGQHPSRWVDFILGQAPEWWSQSALGSIVSRQQPIYFWQHQIENLYQSSPLLLEFSPHSMSGPYLLLAQNNVAARTDVASMPEIEVGSWLIISDASGDSLRLGQHLVKKLQDRGHHVVVAEPGGADHIENLLQETKRGYEKLSGIIHLAGLDGTLQAKALASRLMERQVDRCVIATAIAQACQRSQIDTTYWVITTGAMSDTPSNRMPDDRCSLSPFTDAALWGFGRCLMNEASGYAVRLVDLESPFTTEAVVNALCAEFENPDDEQEIIITSTGARFVPRVRLEARPEAIDEQFDKKETSNIHLGFEMPGQLRNLRWEIHPAAALGADELRIEVHATGLNFRDVMFTLGLLPDEAIENGFTGSTLGLEFAGLVLAVGSAATGFSPGDRVVGFSPSSFGNRVTTPASAVFRISPKISFEAAATIPSAFFTAFYALRHLAQLKDREKILIHGAAGGVGIAAIQIAKWCGAEIYATAGSDEKRDFLRLLGVNHIFDSRSMAFADEILMVTKGDGIDVVLNCLAGEAIRHNFRVLKPFGRFLELGKRDFYENTKVGLRAFRNNISYFGIDADQLMCEHPDLTRELFDKVMALFSAGTLHPLPYRAFEAQDVVDAFRYMQQAKQIGKVVVTYQHGIVGAHKVSRARPRKIEFSANASYLVTGGLSGFGLKTAQWLAARGARNLVLISRRGAVSDEARIAISGLEKAGVKVHAVSCDVTDKKALSLLFDEIGRRLPPLKGIFHAAMVIDDGFVASMDAERIERVLAPKMLGACHLHELALSLKLDYFVLFSSATTLFGNPGQGNYVAANTWLEALAKHRRISGLPALCVRWGAIGDVGILAANENIKDMLEKHMGGSALNSALALDALETLLLANRSGVGVLEFDWRNLSRFLPSARMPKFKELARHAGNLGPDESAVLDIGRLLAELTDEELVMTFSQMLRQEIGEILRISPESITPERSFYEMGLDSLMGAELALALESKIGVRLPVFALNESPTIHKLAKFILVELRSTDRTDQSSAKSNVVGQIQRVVAQHAADVDPDTVANLAKATTIGVSQRIIH